MNKLILIFSVMFCTVSLRAQTEAYVKLKKAIERTHPEIVLDNRLIAFNVWSVAGQEGRDANKSFEKAYEVFGHARLKGGAKGIVVVLVNTDDLSSTAVILLGKDRVSKCISLKSEDLPDFTSMHAANMVFDASGNEVYRDLPADVVFRKIQNLITR